MCVQQFADTQTAAQALATAINTDPGSVFKTLIAKNVHGKASNVEILGPSNGTPTGALHALSSDKTHSMGKQ